VLQEKILCPGAANGRPWTFIANSKNPILAFPYLCSMGRIMGIDYGSKRTGLAVTDPLKMIAQPLEMVYTADLKMYLDSYLYEEEVECFVVGLPTNLLGQDTDATGPVKQFIQALKQAYPDIPVETIDERLTSHEAQQSIIASGAKKSQRQNKGLIDAVSASLILQTYLQKIS
jgi:putative Holliday junction resolvase